MKKIIIKIICYILIISNFFGSGILSVFAEDESADPGEGYSEHDYAPPTNPFDIYDQNLEPANIDEDLVSDEGAVSDEVGTQENANSSDSLEQKIIFSPTDDKILKSILIANSALPSLEGDTRELSRLTGRSVADLESVLSSGYEYYKAIAQEAEAKYFTNDYLKQRLLGDVTKLTELLNFSSETQTIREMQTNRAGIEAQIDTILDYKIDTRIIETLNYLVRPKDDPRGGAGHWKIKVNRIFANYTREQTKESRESDSIYKQQDETNTNTSHSATTSTSDTETTQTIDSINATSATDKNSLTATMKEAGATEENTLLSGEVLNTDGDTVSDFLIPEKEYSKNISSHFKGQAVDISEIDDIRCTVIKLQRIGPRQLEPRPPISVKLGWQTQSGYAQDNSLSDTSFSRMFLQMGQDAMLDMLANLNIDFGEIDSIDTNDFAGIAGIIGQAFFSDAINGPSQNIWKFDLADTLNKLGGVIIADELKLSREPFLDTNILSIDNLYEAIGRYTVEKNLNVPYGSMKGETRWQMMINIGKGRFIRELLLPSGALDATINPGDEDMLMEKIGSRLFEDHFSFPQGSLFGKESLDKISESVGSMKFNAVISNPDALDRRLYLPEGTTDSFKSRTISPKAFFAEVARSHIYPIIYAYPDEDLTRSGDHEHVERRDEALNLELPDIGEERSIDRFLEGNYCDTDYYNLGIYTLANSLEKQEESRSRLINWLREPTQTFTITETSTSDTGEIVSTQQVVDSSSYVATTGVNAVDIYQLLGASSGAKGVFINYGRSIFADAVKNSNMVRRTQSAIIRNNPSLAQNIESYEFIMQRINWIKDHASNLQRRTDAIKTALDSFQESQLPSREREIIRTNFSDLITIVNEADHISSLTGAMQFLTRFRQTSNVSVGHTATLRSLLARADQESGLVSFVDNLNAFQYELEMISKWAYEAVTGKEQPSWRVGDTTIEELVSGDVLTIGDIKLSVADLALFLSGKVKMSEFLLTLGSAKLAGALHLPPKALSYAASAMRALFNADIPMKDIFFRSVGMAAFESKSAENSGLQAQSRPTIPTDELDKYYSAIEIRNQLMQTQNISQAEANKTMMNAFGLSKHDFNRLTTDSDAVWLTARSDAEANDLELSLPIGTTENFMRGRSEGGDFVSSISKDDIRKFATYAGISEISLESFLAVKNGGDPSINQIYYVDSNPYQNVTKTDNTCIQKPIPDGSYVYYDLAGLHTFNTFAAANEYVKANEDKKIDYITEISNALVRMIGNGDESKTSADSNGQPIKSGFRTNYQLSQVEPDIESFINNKNKKYAFSDTGRDSWEGVSTVNIDEFITTKYKIPKELFIKIFSRQESPDATISQRIDILQVIGSQLIKTYAADFLTQQIGINIGPSRITADDIFEIFSGDSRSVFARIGSEILGEALNVSPGTIREIVEAETQAESECALYNAAASILGNAFNINGLDVLGEAFNNSMARQKVEQFLGIPKNSFKGEVWDDLLSSNTNNNGISVSDFYKAFQVPITADVEQLIDDVLLLMSADYYKSYKNQSVYQKMTVVYQYIEALSTDTSVMAISIDMALKWNDLDQRLVEFLDDFLRNYLQNNFNIGNYQANLDSFKSYYRSFEDDEAAEVFNSFINRLASIDSALSLNTNSIIKMLMSEEGKGPDWIVGEVQNRALRSMAFGTLARALGLPEGLTEDDFNAFKESMGICEPTAGVFGSRPCGFNVGGVYDFLSKLFDLKLDSKAKLPPGTISRIIKNPVVGLQIALYEGAKLADKAFGLLDEHERPHTDGSISAYVGLFTFDNYDGENAKLTEYQTAENIKYCSAQARSGIEPYSQCMSNKANAQSVIIRNLTNNLIQNALSKIDGGRVAGVKIYVDGSAADGMRFEENEISISTEEIKGLLNGDFRFVEAVCIYSAIKNYIEVTDDEGNPSGSRVPQRMWFQFQDVHRMIYGNSEMETIAREAAQSYAQRVISGEITDINIDEDSGSYLLPENTNGHIFAPPPNFDRGTNTTTTLVSNRYGNPNEIDVDDQVLMEINTNYPLTEEALPLPLDNPPQLGNFDLNDDMVRDYFSAGDPQQYESKHGEGTYDSFESNYNAYLTADSNWQAIRQAGDAAASRVREIYRQNFENKAADCVLYKIDPNIPSGFYWAMMHGNGYSKSASIITYITNILRSNDLLPEWVDEDIQQAVIDYINFPSHGTEILERVGDQKLFDAVDDMLNKMSLTLMGIKFSFEDGTAKGVFDYLVSGDLSTLEGIYNGQWLASKVFSFADSKLKLPPGTTFTMYNHVRSYMAAQKLNQMWKMPIDQLKTTEVFQKAEARMPGASPEDIQKSGQDATSRQMKEVMAAAVSLVVNLVFSDEIQQFEEQFGLVPGTGSMLVTMLIQSLFGLPVSPMQIAMFVVVNLFGVYKVKYICSANGMYPDGKGQTKDRVSYQKYDYPGFDDFNAVDSEEREQNFIKIAQYKADRLALDLYEMPYRTGNEDLVPLQVMTGRAESAAVAKPLVLGTACKKIGVNSYMMGENGLETAICNGSRVGIWQNPQNTDHTHIGF